MTHPHARLDELGGGPAQRVKRVQFLLRSHLAESERFVVEEGRVHGPESEPCREGWLGPPADRSATPDP